MGRVLSSDRQWVRLRIGWSLCALPPQHRVLTKDRVALRPLWVLWVAAGAHATTLHTA